MRNFKLTLAALGMCLVSVNVAEAGLFGKKCGQKSSCEAAAPSCCEPAPAPSCCEAAPAPCCAPAPAPAPCCAPAPAPAPCCEAAPAPAPCCAPAPAPTCCEAAPAPCCDGGAAKTGLIRRIHQAKIQMIRNVAGKLRANKGCGCN